MPAKKKAVRRTAKKQAELKNSYIYDTVTALILLLAAALMFVGLLSDSLGPVGQALQYVLLGFFGAGGIIVPIIFTYTAVLLILKKSRVSTKFWCFMLFAAMFSAFYNVCVFVPAGTYFAGNDFQGSVVGLTSEFYNKGLTFGSGGVLGGWLSYPLELLCAKLGAGIIIFVLMLATFVLTTGITFAAFKRVRPEYPEDKNLGAKAENKALKKDIKFMRQEIDTLKKQKFVIPETDEPESARLSDIDDGLQAELRKYEKPYKDKKNKKDRKKAESQVDDDPELRKNKEDFDDLLFQFKAKPAVNPVPFFAQGARVKTETIAGKKLDEASLTAELSAAENILSDSKPLLFDDEKKAEASVAAAKAEEIGKSFQKAEEENQKKATDDYAFPPISMLSYTPDNNAALYKEELRQNAVKLTDALHSFGVEATVVDAKRGPTVTRYELTPNAGVKISKFTNLSDDIALHLAAPAVRIEAPIPGKAAIGIEIPNKSRSTVYLKEIVASEEFRSSKSKISVALGRDISGQATVIDLAKMPHLLIAGATGSGKSICINSILMSLLFRSSPNEVKLLLVDPKVVELNVYNGIPHLLIPVVTNPEKAAGALSWAVSEMLNRYKLFAEKGVRDFSGYNKTLPDGEKKLPQIVVVIDELADLMMVSPTEVEDAICRLAQMARAAGMHLVIATQRPSADVITGIIKANIPSRIAFAVSSQIDSRIILDGSGAEKLIGKGDMLYDPLGAAKPLRVQGSYVSDKEVESVIDFIKNNYVSEYDNSIIEKIEQNVSLQKNGKRGASGGQDDDDEAPEDDKLQEAIRCVVENGQASVSMLQRKIGLGFSRAGKLIDEMEKRGIVGPYQGSKPREVLLTKAQWLEMQTRRDDDN